MVEQEANRNRSKGQKRVVRGDEVSSVEDAERALPGSAAD